MDSVIEAVKVFFGAAGLVETRDALAVCWCATGCDLDAAVGLVEEALGEEAGSRADKMGAPGHVGESLGLAVEALTGAQRRLEVDGGWELIDAVVRRELVLPYHEVISGLSPLEAEWRGGVFEGDALIEPAVQLLHRALTGWDGEELARPVALAGEVRVYDAERAVWVAYGKRGVGATLQALWRTMMGRGVVVQRTVASVKGSKEKVPQWRVVRPRDSAKWDRLCHSDGGKWALAAVEDVSGDRVPWVRGGLHLEQATLRLVEQDGVWAIAEGRRGAAEHALYALPYAWEEVISSPAPLFEALLDNLTAGYQASGEAEQVKGAIKRWVGLALLGAGALGVELPLLAITGLTGSGKSTLLQVLKELLPHDAVSSVGLKTLLGDEGYREAVVGKLLNVDLELSGDLLPGGETFKQIMSSEPVPVWRMGEARYAASLSAMFATAGQNTPRFKDLDTAVLRRVIHVHVEAAVDHREGRPILEYHKVIVRQEGPGIVGACLRALHEWQQAGMPLTLVEDARAEWLVRQREEIRAESNTAVLFWRECVQEGPMPSDRQRGSVSLAHLYACYKRWCEDTRGGGKCQSKQAFHKSLKDGGVTIYMRVKNAYFPTALIDDALARAAGVHRELPPGRTWVEGVDCTDDQGFGC